MDFLYRYITHPKQTLATYSEQPILRYSIVVLLLLAFMNISFFLPGILLQQLWITGIFAWLLFSEAVMMDFIAQIFGYQGQSYRLFQWLCVSWIPFLLLPPLTLLSHVLGITFGAAMIVILGLVLYLQIITFKELYQANNTAILGFYLVPVGVFLVAIIFFFMLMGSIFSGLLGQGSLM